MRAKTSDQIIVGGIQAAEVALTSLEPQGAKQFVAGGLTIEEAILRFGRTYVGRTAVFPEAN